ncbi:MFS transporter [bacterium]|nr:MFS transporter [bacterium]
MAGTNKQTPILIVLFLGVLMAALDIAILGPAIPAIRDAFGLSERQVSWVFSVWVLANLVSVPIMSKMADRFGRKAIYIFDIALFAAGGVVVAAAPGFEVLLIGRAMQGAAASGIFPVAGAVIGDAFEPEKRGRAFGVLGSVFGVAFIIGPILAGTILMVGWRWLYLIFVPISLLVIGLGWFILPSQTQRTDKPVDKMGLVSLAGILLAAAYAISVLDTANLLESLLGWRVINSGIVILVLIPFFIRSAKHAVDPVIRIDLFRNRQVAIALLIAIGAGISEAAFIFFPTIARLAYQVTMSEASFMLLPLMISVAIGSPLAGRLLDKTGSKLVVLLSMVLLGLGMFGIATSPGAKPVFYVASVFIGLGLAGLLGSALSYILIHEAKKQERAVSQGAITLFISIGQLLSAAMVGAIAASSEIELEGYKTAFSVIVVITFGMTACAFFLKNKLDERETVFRDER